MLIHKLLLALCLLPMTAVSSNKPSGHDTLNEIVATWQAEGVQKLVTRAELNAWRRNAPRKSASTHSDIEQIALTWTLATEAASLGLLENPDAQARRKRLGDDLAATDMSRVLNMESRPTENELRAAYEARAGEWRKPARWRLRNLLVPAGEDARKRINTLIAALDAGADFAALANEHSASATRLRGGDIGWVEARSLAPNVRIAVTGLKPGEKTVIEGEKGLTLIECTEIRAASTRTFEQVRQRLGNELAAERRSTIMAGFAKHHAAGAGVVEDEPASRQRILAAEARRRGLTETTGYHERLVWAERRLSADIALASRVAARIEAVSDAQVAAFYHGNPQRFMGPERFLFSALEISLGEKVPRAVIKRAQRATRDLPRGDLAWDALAMFVDPSGKHVRMQNLGWLSRNDFFHLGLNGSAAATALADSAGLNSEARRFSELLQEGKKLMILRYRDRRAAHTAPLTKVQERVRGQLTAQRQQVARQDIEAEILDSLKIEMVQAPRVYS